MPDRRRGRNFANFKTKFWGILEDTSNSLGTKNRTDRKKTVLVLMKQNWKCQFPPISKKTKVPDFRGGAILRIFEKIKKQGLEDT